jgi:tetratricopeptide (TPR) repeat protein
MATETIKCKYFPMLPARWHCMSCDVNIANECAKTILPYHPDNKKICPICTKPLNSIGIANSIKPFWYRIPKFFTYPAKPKSLIYMGVLSLFILISFFVPIIAFLVYIFAFFGILQYACKCLSNTARGDLSPPDIFVGNDKQYANISLKQFAIFLFIIFVATKAFSINILLGFGVVFFALLSIPASTMLLAMTGSFVSAINPMTAAKIMFGMGKSYLILYLFLLLMIGSNQFVQLFALKVISPIVLLPFLFFINSYFTIAMFSMMGYAIYQYHEEFGFDEVEEVNLEAEGIDIKASGISQDSFINEIHILVSEGLLDEAVNRLKKQLNDFPKNFAYHDKYHALLKLTNNSKGMAIHTTEYIDLLLRESKIHKGKIITIYTDCLKMNPDYFYANAAVLLDLAKTAQELFRNSDALSLLNKFSQNYPNSQEIPYAYFIAAQLLVEHKQQEDQAKKILSSLLNKYPDHELTEKIKDYLNLIEKLRN